MFIGSESIDLGLCLIDSAQCFTWARADDGYIGMIENTPAFLYQRDGATHAETALSAETVRHYLDLDRAYGAVAAQYAHIPAARRAIELYPGLRVLNQAPWDALLSFILSANNNVSRIRNLSRALRESFGPAGEICGRVVHAFPDAETLAAVDEMSLRALGVGYRAPYLIKTARMVRDGFDLSVLRDMPYPDAHARLTELSGVGDKVADCVLLFGCGHSCAFPVDTWVEKLLIHWFGFSDHDRARLCCAARELLGSNAGLLQQFLFHAARMGDLDLPK